METTVFSVALLLAVFSAVLVAAQGYFDFQIPSAAAAHTVASAVSPDPPIAVSVVHLADEEAIALCNFAARSGADPDTQVTSGRAFAAFA